MEGKANKLGVAVVGCGTVGSSVARLLFEKNNLLKTRLSRPLALRWLVDLDFSRAKALGVEEKFFTHNLKTVLEDPAVDVVCELVGGTTQAQEIIKQSLAAGKHVVTANKALLATFGNELFALARQRQRCILFEASCAGGIPIIRALYDGLIANRIEALFGIVNGTCNYILTRMTQAGKTYSEALTEAQAKGFAEQDPYLDVSGLDSAHKLAILAALAFGQKINLEAIKVEGIDKLALCDLKYGEELGYTIKLLAMAQRLDDGLYQAVKPAFIPKSHPLAWVNGPFNAVSVYGSVNGHTMYYGRGAGGNATASAVIADLVSLSLGNAYNSYYALNIWPDQNKADSQLPVKEALSRFYIRIQAEDQPGVLAQIAGILGYYKISLSSVLQKEKHEPENNNSVPVVITTHPALESALRKALAEIDKLPVIYGQSVYLAILDEYQEIL